MSQKHFTIIGVKALRSMRLELRYAGGRAPCHASAGATCETA